MTQYQTRKHYKNHTFKVIGGANCRIGLMNPRWGGSKRKPVNTSESMLNISEVLNSIGGACPCQAVSQFPVALGGYKPTKRNLHYLKKWRKGESIGFTMRSSLKAKGLIPRADGKKRISAKYRK